MIRWDIDGLLGLVSKQTFDRPVVYLDHWAVRRLSDDPVLGKRFISALKACGGTWAISLLNLMEFIPMTDQDQASRVEVLIDEALPNLFFIDYQVFSVIDREKAILNGGSREAPYGDKEFLAAFASMVPDTPRPFTVKSLVSAVVQHRDSLSAGLGQLKQTLVSRIESMRDQMTKDRSLEQRIRGSQKAAVAQPTLLFLREFVGTLLREPTKKITENDAMDLLHTIIPVTYCDFVLLDAPWAHRVGQVRERLIKHKIGLRMAKVFSGKASDMELFLKSLESHPYVAR